jgi:uncharacterized protein YbjT (DUF2867 family)
LVSSTFTDDPSLKRVLVTGATGNTGASLLGELQGTGIEPVAALTSEDAKSRLPFSCEYRLCNYDDASQAAAALDGIDAVFLLIPFNEKMVAWGERFIEQALRRGVRFVVRLSGLAAAPDCESKMGRLHGRIDEFLKSSEIPWCILRCNAFMQNFTGAYRGMIRRGVLCLPEGNARSAFVDTRDIAAVTAHILNNPAPHINRVYDLSGPESLSNDQAVKIISAACGNPVRYKAMSEAEVRRAYHKLGISPWHMEVLESLSRFIRGGHADEPTGTVEALLSRPPATFRRFAQSHRRHWIDSELPNRK